jgi:2-polyprenyl-6-methoxyphenol hydroxylase-like FAD-dependent oxidoreductase
MRIIIIGSGPAGLTTAHCLLAAGLPFSDLTVLERRPDPLDHGGAGIALYPSSLRVMDQLGILEEIIQCGEPLKESLHVSPGGHIYNRGWLFKVLEE